MNLSTHVSVLLQEAIEHLNLREGHTYVDMTLGGGGHSQANLDQLQGGLLFCFVQDDYALAYAKERLSNY
ncbi:MAG: 16S rRNA (cytosine(1402)-N(4))-methyltransferase, partial [Candidatus Izemoplasmatales bacterium]